MSKIIDGKQFAANLRVKIKSSVENLITDHGITPGLAVVLVGNNPASEVYVRSKARQTKECGMNSYEHRLDSSVSQQELLDLVNQLNADPKVNGILVQLPLPDHIDDKAIINSINVEKDVDGFHILNVGRLSINQTSLVPCTPLGSIMLLKDTLGDLTGLNAVIVGRSNIVGKPMAQLLLKENATVTIAHSRTKNLAEICSQADIVVAAVGRAKMVKKDWVKPGAVVIDVGINRIVENDKPKLVGDVDFDEVKDIAGAITPVPGGVGPMTIACLLHNTLTATLRQNNIAENS